MALSTVQELRDSIKKYLDRDDLSGDIDDFIRLAESRHRQEIRIREMIQRDALTIDDRYVTIPTGFLEAKTIRLLTNPRTPLENVSNHQMDSLSRTGNGKPRYFTIHKEIEFEINPDQSFSGEIVFYKEFTPLDDTNPSNDLLTRAPDAYLYAALLASATFLMDDQRLSVWAGLYGTARDLLNNKKDTRVGPQNARVYGATP